MIIFLPVNAMISFNVCFAWVKVFRINPEVRILRLTFN